ncbi:MAG: hypothetical protein KJN72_01645 [Woeseia sp.]|nr:hypothetical protein [Woeseia sp.]
MEREIKGAEVRRNPSVWVAVATGLILLVPFIAMQFTSEVNWDLQDFLIMGLLLLCAGSLFVVISRRSSLRGKILTGVVIAAIFLFVWAELAVGIFTHSGP